MYFLVQIKTDVLGMKYYKNILQTHRQYQS